MEQVLYKLPDGWEWRTIEEAAQIGADRGFAPTPDSEGNVPFIGMTDIDQETGQKSTYELRNFDDVKKGYTKFQRNAVLFAKITPCTENNKTALIANVEGGFATTEVFPIHALDSVEPKYLLHFFRSPSVRRFLIDHMEGATGRQRVPLKALKSVSIPVCGLREQKRIVEKLDALLTRIDTAIEHLQESVTLKKNLLQSALDGQFAVIAERMTIESLAEVKGGKRLPKGQKLSDEETEHPYIRVADFTDKGTIDLSGIKYISKEIHEQIKRYVISKDDLYISIAGTIGKTGFVPPELDGANLTENAAKLVIKDKQQLDLSYLYLFTLTSDFSAQAGLATKTVAQPKLALTRLSKIEIPKCSLEEQKSLVSTIEALKSKIHDAEAVLLGKIEDLKSLKASILDSAFKGEL
ncbi:restriction endonuclease subunit S [Shewanella sp. 1180_01]|uniref:restriction endonuclease subunit S n=1 Tax=Shewanella sp. 1180_01 TaxID=2604451 RepID=UPI0040645B4E